MNEVNVDAGKVIDNLLLQVAEMSKRVAVAEVLAQERLEEMERLQAVAWSHEQSVGAPDGPGTTGTE